MLKANFSLFTAIGFVPILVWSACVAIASSSTASLGGFTAAGICYLSAGLLLGIILWLRGGFRREIKALNPRTFFITLIPLSLNLGLFWFGMSLAKDLRQVAELGLINYLWCTFVVLFAIPILGRRASPLLLVGLLISILGAVLPVAETKGLSLSSIFQNIMENPVAYLTVFLCAVSWGVYSNVTKKFEATINSTAVACFLFIIGCSFITLGFFIGEVSQWNQKALIEVLGLGAGDALAYVCWDIAMRRGDQIMVSTLAYFTPVLSTAFTALYLHIPIGPVVWCGAGLIILGAWVSRKAFD